MVLGGVWGVFCVRNGSDWAEKWTSASPCLEDYIGQGFKKSIPITVAAGIIWELVALGYRDKAGCASKWGGYLLLKFGVFKLEPASGVIK